MLPFLLSSMGQYTRGRGLIKIVKRDTIGPSRFNRVIGGDLCLLDTMHRQQKSDLTGRANQVASACVKQLAKRRQPFPGDDYCKP
jgi:hypothetical protein